MSHLRVYKTEHRATNFYIDTKNLLILHKTINNFDGCISRVDISVRVVPVVGGVSLDLQRPRE
jgi:hypothetical protein